MNRLFSSFMLLLTCGFALSAGALDIHFDQDLQQGALLTGKTDAVKLSVLGRTLKPDAKGQFVFGLGRDAEPQLEVTLVGANGESELKRFTVLQRQYDLQEVNGVAKKYVSPPKEVSARISEDAAEVRKARELDRPEVVAYQQGFKWPAQGRISGVYGSQRVFNGVPKRPHYGLDIAAPTGTPVFAPVDGLVSLAHKDMYYSGGTLILDHGRGVSSTFIHLSQLHVKLGEEVKQGQLIGEIGATGRVTGPHLDWRINWFDQRLDPALLLPSAKPEPLP
ncbi:M23 family metallopeptidase [Agaribacterium sp. ZY112]|uniref:M23 family metallopeptidase n=1 Tax=Agaribacterium sp. ZY112 TaxID=3233574 RepID=UPI0035258756